LKRKEWIKVMQARENMYRFLARMYKQEIDAPLLAQLEKMDFSNYKMLADYLAGKDSHTLPVLTELAADYAKVFLAAGSTEGLAAVPYESIYTSPKRIVMQEAWEQVRDEYAAHGFVLGDVSADYMEDHMACELEYMALLCHEAADRWMEGTCADCTEECDSQVPDNESFCRNVLDVQTAFLKQHLLLWAPAFNEDIARYAETDFYKAIGQMTVDYLKSDADILNMLADEPVEEDIKNESYALSFEAMDEVIARMSEKYRIFAPKRLANRGARKGTDLVRYGEITSVREIVYDRQSDFSPKEVIYPVMQTMFYFTEDECRASELKEDKDLLIFARPCDINGLERLDNIFLNNGQPDLYYSRMRERVKFVMMECGGCTEETPGCSSEMETTDCGSGTKASVKGFEHCFCVSMGTNKTDNYSAAMRLTADGVLVSVKDSSFSGYFRVDSAAQTDFEPVFVQENIRKVTVPVIENREMLKKVSQLDFWNKYDDQCIGCGGCNTVCMTCSCFDTVDIIYNEGNRDGERRRVWSSCMLADFTRTAGGARARKTPGANMRFKAMHKIYDYNARFGGDAHMCAGCGRCDIRCPKDISFFEVITTLNSEIEKMKAEAAASPADKAGKTGEGK